MWKITLKALQLFWYSNFMYWYILEYSYSPIVSLLIFIAWNEYFLFSRIILILTAFLTCLQALFIVVFCVTFTQYLLLTREWSQLYISELIQNRTTNKIPQLNMKPVGILCKWPAAARPEATKAAAPCYFVPPLRSLPLTRALTIPCALQSCVLSKINFSPLWVLVDW